MSHTHKHVVSRRRRGARLVDPLETSQDRYDHIPSPEVSKVQEALESSTFELHAVVTDPLPDALRLAESLKVRTSGDNEARDLADGNANNASEKAPNSSHDRKGKALEADGNDKDQNIRTKPNFFERNSTAHTMEVPPYGFFAFLSDVCYLTIWISLSLVHFLKMETMCLRPCLFW